MSGYPQPTYAHDVTHGDAELRSLIDEQQQPPQSLAQQQFYEQQRTVQAQQKQQQQQQQQKTPQQTTQQKQQQQALYGRPVDRSAPSDRPLVQNHFQRNWKDRLLDCGELCLDKFVKLVGPILTLVCLGLIAMITRAYFVDVLPLLNARVCHGASVELLHRYTERAEFHQATVRHGRSGRAQRALPACGSSEP
jgi:hypothetical protein